ncbi:glycosyltransferase [Chryseobacterium salivictor]|uniref:Uncharacterized protein n=1 Tax=Chryseobacterium salivictor TaxID=2547600 RepID=A0A4P6ZFV1_9FLAO|nr:glycosyltransferase [Chryseobacterium salivictor]QBO58372.1 hypothetical protein NBC122_01557 [Chryseobacterium salivictor]
MKVLFLTKYSALGASSRLRTFQYLPFYREAGIECIVEPFFNDSYLERLYNGKGIHLLVFSFYLKRLLVLLSILKYDKIYIEKEIFPYLPPFAEWILFLLKKKYIVDYDDAIFHNYDRNKNVIVRIFLKNKIDSVMKYAEVVIAGNAYLAQRATDAGAKHTEIIPTVVDLKRYTVRSEKKEDVFVIGWIGTKSTFEKHLLSIKDWLIKAQQLLNVELHVIGITKTEVFLGDHVKLIPWTENTEVAHLSKFDVGIMPLRDSPWERGKCAYKIIQYFAVGIPVIASDVGMNAEVCINGETGFLANTEEGFLGALKFLITHEDTRKEMGMKGRKVVEKTFNVEATSKILTNIILN